jgi:hypothetical protein
MALNNHLHIARSQAFYHVEELPWHFVHLATLPAFRYGTSSEKEGESGSHLLEEQGAGVGVVLGKHAPRINQLGNGSRRCDWRTE